MSLTLRRFAPVALVLVGTTVGLLLVESTLRVAGLWAMPDYAATNWYRQSSLPGVPYLLKPNLGITWGGGRIATDEFGLRNEHPAAKPQRVYRILTLGDSVTFGFGVDQKRSFPAVLQDLLNTKGGQQYQVINAGIPGYNIADEGALLPALLARYKPDLVLWTLVSNDYDDSLGVDPEGRITQSNIDHVIEAGFVANWGHNGKPYIDVEDFRRSMLPRVRAELEGRPQPISTAGSLDAWLSSHLYAWSFSRAKATALPAFPGTLKPTEAEILGRYTTADGHHLLMQFFSPVYSSRHVIDQANRIGRSR